MSERLLVQRIGLIGLMNLLTNLGGIILLPILTKNISVGDYGIWAQVNVTVGLISILILLGLPQSMVRFMAAAKGKDEIRESFYSILLTVAVAGAMVSIILYFFSDTLAALLFDNNLAVTRVLPLIVFLESINAILFNFFRASQHIKLYSLFSLMSMYLSIVLAYYFVSSGQGILGAVIGLLLSKAAICLVMLLLVLARIGFKLPNFKKIGEFLSFGLPLIPSGLSDWVVNSSDRYVISIFLGTASVGYYSPGYLLGNIITMFITPVACILPVVLSQHYDENNLKRVETILNHSLRYFFALALPSVFGLTLLSWPLLSLLSTQEIADKGYIITPFVAVGMLFFGVASILTNIILLVKKTKYSAIIWIVAAALNLVLTILLVPRLDILGAALATLIAFIFVLASTAYYAMGLFPVRVDGRFFLKCLIASLAMSMVIIFWHPQGLLEIAGSIVICTAVYFLALWILKGIDRDEIGHIKNMFIIK